nr:CRISPR-associated helicase Cas3' [Ferrimicrobium acidiphilum]
MSAFIEFLSHSYLDKNGNKRLLKDHLMRVAEKTRQLIADTSIRHEDIAYYSGLLHDVGKLNPWYQLEFSGYPQNGYTREHAVFSAWAADSLLSGVLDDRRDRLLVMSMAAGHHTSLKKELSSDEPNRGNDFNASRVAVAGNLMKFHKQVSNLPGFDRLNWGAAKAALVDLDLPVDFQKYTAGGSFTFLEAGALYSALLQADKGDLAGWPNYHYDVAFDTAKLIKDQNMSPLADIRTKMQADISKRQLSSVSVIQAPTGSGKTKIFLDLIPRYGHLERVFYFSPLLALTDDFEEKMHKILSKSQLDDILVYNHLFAGSLLKKYEDSDAQAGGAYSFTDESFNRKMVISTTQRLLRILYSNYASEKIKLMSFRNALVIIDEVQTIPKFILPNLISLLKELAEKMGTKVLLVSATVPEEVRSAGLTILSPSKELMVDYYSRQLKGVEYQNDVDPSSLVLKGGRNLVMVNTRAKAVRTFLSLPAGTLYLSSGVKKGDRMKSLSKVKDALTCTVVATQVIEAGVNVSFDRVVRELAPLDNLVQVMGRLGREEDTSNGKKRLMMYVFRFPGDETHAPYVGLEYEKTRLIMMGVHGSTDLISALPSYYEELYSANKSNQSLLRRLESYEAEVSFEMVWKVARDHLFDESDRQVIIPDSEEQMNRVNGELLNIIKNTSRKWRRSVSNSYGQYMATLPPGHEWYEDGSLWREFFDEELREHGILFPKAGKLDDLYDKTIGLDKHLNHNPIL